MSISVALVGLGDIGLRAHLPALLAREDVVLAAIADVDADRVNAVRRSGGSAQATTDVAGVLEDPGIDAVVLATPQWVTPILARQALAVGKWVLAEKPLAPTLAEAAALATEPGADERLQIGLTYRHHPAVERLRQLVRNEILGRPLIVQATISDEPANPRTDPVGFARRLRSLEHAPPIISDGVHACDRLNYLLEAKPTSVQGFATATDARYANPNANLGILEYEDGTLVRLEVLWLVPVLPPSQFVVTGPRGRAVLDPPTFELMVDLADGTHEHLPPPGDKTEVCFAQQLDRFLHHCRSGTAPVPGVTEALASLELAQRIAAASGLAPEGAA